MGVSRSSKMDSFKKSSLPKKVPQTAASRLRRMTTMSTGSSTGNNNNKVSTPIQARFGHDSSDETTSLITHLDKYSDDELKEYRQVFNMFDAGEFDLIFFI